MLQVPVPLSDGYAPTAAPTGKALVARLLLGAILTSVICLAIAVVLTLIDRVGFGTKLVYSFSIGMVCWLTVDVLHRPIRWAIDRHRARRGRPALAEGPLARRALLAFNLVVAVALGPTVGLAIGNLLTGHRSPGLDQLESPSAQLTLAMTLAGTGVSVVVLALFERTLRLRTQAQIALREAAEYRLKLLESQLEPHMLFNTLANLRILIGSDARRAQTMLDHLNAFLRGTLQGSRAPWHSLATEFARIDDYLALMAIRMGARLGVTLLLPDELRDVPVPPLLLQPLVENAIRHGLEPKVGPGRLIVRARRQGGALLLEVRDTGVGLRSNDKSTGAATFGIEHVRARLRTVYGDAATLTLQEAADEDGAHGGATAIVRLPLPHSTSSPNVPAGAPMPVHREPLQP